MEKLEGALEQWPYFFESVFSLVNAVSAPLCRYFDPINPAVTQLIFHGLPRMSRWREALASRESFAATVGQDYPASFKQHLAERQAILAD
ncbi:glutathione S-transferase C-terminal domain-containing protein [Pseudomonas sp. H11T01]|uniref:glutathione S-transferase C-terminal domain-containing protein n=1 Tax=Pseudomonas sp. H11T01 TaxID=3402749 RepID=UPI003AD2689A